MKVYYIYSKRGQGLNPKPNSEEIGYTQVYLWPMLMPEEQDRYK